MSTFVFSLPVLATDVQHAVRQKRDSAAMCVVCVCVVQVVFINDQTGEYQYYEIQFRAVRPGVMATIKLSTTVRQRKQHSLMLENPLTTAVTFNASCNTADLQIPSQTSVPAQSEVQCRFHFIRLYVTVITLLFYIFIL